MMGVCLVSIPKPTIQGLIGWLKMEGAKCKLHPLIHTFAPENSAQDVEKKKAERKTPHFLSSNQDIVANPQDEKCGLKYDTYTCWRRILI